MSYRSSNGSCAHRDLNIIPAVTAMRQGERAGGGDRAPGPAHPRLPGEDQHHLDDQHQHQH